jgi:hypothetical protein
LKEGWPTSIGTGGRFQSECPADIIGIRSQTVFPQIAPVEIAQASLR